MNKPDSIQGVFNLADNTLYEKWREQKLLAYPSGIDQLIVEIHNLQQLTRTEHQAVRDRVGRYNMALYSSQNANHSDKTVIQDLGRQFGLHTLDHNMGADEDAISSLTVQDDALHKGYIPYTNRAITWHTDGYYNEINKQIHALLLHCVQPAQRGGENALLDHEILYILLRDENPDYVQALMHPQAMTIPANIAQGKTLRPARTGPVFRIRKDGQLHMRYTDRSRSIEWRDDPLTQQAVAALKKILHSDTPYHFSATLQSGQGLISNNLLHTRSGFEDDAQKRLLYRARYYDRISSDDY